MVEDFNHAGATAELGLGLGIEIGAETGRRLRVRWYCAKSPLILPATCFMALIWAALPTRETERPTEMAGRIP